MQHYYKWMIQNATLSKMKFTFYRNDDIIISKINVIMYAI